VIPGRDGERQGFRDEALRVDVALDASGAAAYRGARPASLYVERVGPVGAPTVYYLHGGPGYNAASFREIAGGDLEDLDVVYADQRGAGRSTGEGGSDVGLLAADVFAVMDALGVARAALLAHGFGALVALRAARTAPERVTRLVLVNPWVSMPQLARDLHAEATGTRSGPAEEPADPRALVDEAFGLVNPKVLFDAMQFPSAKSRLFLEHVDAVALSGETPEDVDDAVWLAEGLHDLRAAAASGVTVVLLAGRLDRTSYPGQAELVLEAAPGATFALLDAGHYPWIDDEGFAATLREALTGGLG
jgi:proline iminopeptidase